jgi:hypothetical protein
VLDWPLTLICILCKDIVRTSLKTQGACVITPGQSVLYNDIIAVYYDNFTEYVSAFWIKKYGAFMRIRNTAKSDCQYRHVFLPAWNNYVPTEQICVKFSEIFKCIFWKSVEKIQVCVKSDKNDRYFIRRPLHIYGSISWIVRRIKNVLDQICRENQNTLYVQFFFFFKNRAICEIMCKIILQPDRPQVKIQQYGTCTLRAGYQRLQTHTQNM